MRSRQMTDKRWTISQNQWQLLLSQCGKETEYGMYFTKEQQDKRQVAENLYQMVKEGILLPKEEKLEISSEYKMLLELCNNAKKGCLIEYQEGNQTMFLYLGEKSVICESSAIQSNGFTFSVKSEQELLFCLMEKDIFPSYQIENKEEPVWEIQGSVLEKESLELWKNHKVESIVTFFELETGKKTGRFLLYQEDGEEYLVVEKKGEKGKGLLLHEKNLRQIWKELWLDGVFRSGSTCAWTGV